MSLMNIYFNDPTAAGTDGTKASESGDLTSPIRGTVTSTASTGGQIAIKCAARCDEGYQTSGTIQFKFVNSSGADYTGDNYKLALDDSYSDAADALANATWDSTISTNTIIRNQNWVFWVKLASPAGSIPTNDTSILLWHRETVEVAD